MPTPPTPDQPPAAGLHRYAVGELYNPNRTRWEEIPQLRLSPNGCELVLLLANPTPAEVGAVGTGEARFGLVTTDHLLLWLWRFGSLPWSDTGWEAGRQTDLPVGIPGARGDGRHLLLHVVLVDAATGIIRAMRAVTVPPRMADALRDAVARQQQAGFDPAAAQTQVAELLGISAMAVSKLLKPPVSPQRAKQPN